MRLQQCSKQRLPNSVKLSERSMDCNDIQPENAIAPMEVTDFELVTVRSHLLFSKADLPIFSVSDESEMVSKRWQS